MWTEPAEKVKPRENDPPLEMTLLEHLAELRGRILVSAAAIVAASIACYIFYEQLFAIFYRPYGLLPGAGGPEGKTLFINSIFEGFLVRVKLSVVAGIIVSFPVHLYNLVRFVFPGLTARERRIIGWALAASLLLVAGSFYYGYFFMLPIGVRFLTTSGFIPAKVGLLLNYGKNLFYVLQLLLLTMLVFQLPVLLEVLLIVKVLKRRALWKASRYIVFAIFIIAAVFTPPDFVSQLCMAVPLIGLFYLTLMVARLAHFGED